MGLSKARFEFQVIKDSFYDESKQIWLQKKTGSLAFTL